MPGAWPVTITWPKLRIVAPCAWRLRSITATDSPRLAAAQACAMPSMPAPTTITSKFFMCREPTSEALARFPSRGAVTDRQSRFRAAPPGFGGKRFNATKNGKVKLKGERDEAGSALAALPCRLPAYFFFGSDLPS